MDSKNPNHIVMVAENTRSSSTTFEQEAPAENGKDWSIENGPDGTDEEVAATFEKLNRMIRFVKDSSDEDFRAHFGEYLNLDACINYLCFIDLANARDNCCKNMVMVTYDGLVWYPSLYDLDSTWGLWFDGEREYDVKTIFPGFFLGGSSLLWNRMLTAFPEEIRQRYFELRETVLSEENIRSQFEWFAKSIPAKTMHRERDRWPDVPGQEFGYDQIMNHFARRSAFVDEQMRLLGQPTNEQ